MFMLEKKLKEYLLNNFEELRDVVSELNGWNGCLDYLEFFENDEYFFESFYSGMNGLEIARAIYYGDYRYNDDYVRINSYGNLESYTEDEMIEKMKDSIDEIVKNLIEEHDGYLYLSDDIKEIFEEAKEVEEQKKNS